MFSAIIQAPALLLLTHLLLLLLSLRFLQGQREWARLVSQYDDRFDEAHVFPAKLGASYLQF